MAKYALVVGAGDRILSICDAAFAPVGAIIVDSLPDNFVLEYTDTPESGKNYDITKYLWRNNKYVKSGELDEHSKHMFYFLPETWTQEHRGLLTYARLWHNGDPNSEGSWKKTTKTYDNIYDMFMIICYNSTEGCLLSPIYIRPTGQTKGLVQYTATDGVVRQRKFSAAISSDQTQVIITIDDAIKVGAGGTQNAYCIPFQIYGIKGMTYRA